MHITHVEKVRWPGDPVKFSQQLLCGAPLSRGGGFEDWRTSYDAFDWNYKLNFVEKLI